MIDRHPESRHSRAARVVARYRELAITGGPACPIDTGTTTLVYHTELTARWRCRLNPRHEFSLPIAMLSEAIR